MGSIGMLTANAGSEGVSGKIFLSTGLSNKGDAGFIRIETGNATDGKAGDFLAKVGVGNSGKGGSVEIIAGSTKGSPGRNRKPIDTAGGSINMSSGRSLYTSSGKILISTPDAGRLGVSGTLNLRTGLATEGEAGFIALNSGNSINGSGGQSLSLFFSFDSIPKT